MRSLFSNLNARLIIIHLIAFWFFFYAFQTFAFLHDPDLLIPRLAAMIHVTFPQRFNFDKTLIEQLGNLGILVAYVISWFIASKWNWHWINGVIVFVIAFALGNLKWFGWDTLSGIILAPGKLFNKAVVNILVNGTIMLAVGLALLLLKGVIKYINNGDPKVKRKVEAEKIARRVK